MPLELEGGCLVAGLREGEPERAGGLRIWSHFRGVNVALRVIEGKGSIQNSTDEVLYDLAKNEGIYLPAESKLDIDGSYVAVQTSVGTGFSPSLIRANLTDQPLKKTGDRFYTELIQSDITQFVGSIPPGRAPDHFHLYEEVLCILEGHGTMWAGKTSAPIAEGSCVYLPRKQVHCVENLSNAQLRLLGVFYPAGSPAVRYGVHDGAEGGPEGG